MGANQPQQPPIKVPGKPAQKQQPATKPAQQQQPVKPAPTRTPEGK